MTIGITRNALFRNLADSEYVVADVETTGLDPNEDRVVEFSLVRFVRGLPKARLSALVDPQMAIPPTASAVHALTNRHVSGRPSLEDYADDIRDFAGDTPVIAHNAEFDRQYLPMLDESMWICSLRLARRLWPDAPRYSNQVLRYWLNLDDEYDLTAGASHRAEADAVVTGHLFALELDLLNLGSDVETMSKVADVCWAPIPVERFAYGKKYRGAKIDGLPIDYIRWVDSEQKKPDDERKLMIDADTHAALKAEMNARKAALLRAS